MLEGTLDVSSDGGTVTFRYTIENTGSEPVDVMYRDGQRFDIAVEKGDKTVWRWSNGQMFTMAISEETFDPGQTETYTAKWDSPQGGSYTAVATCAAQSEDAEATTEFSV